MARKPVRELLAEAKAAADSVSAEEALELARREDVVFVDVREGHEHAQAHIAGAIHAPRGFLEFIADPEAPMHNPVFASGKRLVVYCGSGGRSALACKTLRDMGLNNLATLEGGFQAWVEAGGPCEP